MFQPRGLGILSRRSPCPTERGTASHHHGRAQSRNHAPAIDVLDECSIILPPFPYNVTDRGCSCNPDLVTVVLAVNRHHDLVCGEVWVAAYQGSHPHTLTLAGNRLGGAYRSERCARQTCPHSRSVWEHRASAAMQHRSALRRSPFFHTYLVLGDLGVKGDDGKLGKLREVVQLRVECSEHPHPQNRTGRWK